MSNLLQDFFHPDLSASNRALKKYLDEEGLRLGFRDLVSIRAAAEAHVYFSFALLEAWSDGEFQAQDVVKLLESPESFRELCEAYHWSSLRTASGAWLVGVEGELVQDEPSLQSSEGSEELGGSLVPLSTVYGGSTLVNSPGVGGAWKEEELQASSLTLLDGESEERLVEAFRHLFRAAPSGAARAAVVATALARHRPELNREVADKLEELSPSLGQALRQLFTNPEQEGRQALEFLLAAHVCPQAPVWLTFWQGIRTTVLESLARSESGRQLLRESLAALRAAGDATGEVVLTHRLVDAFLVRQDLITSNGRGHLLSLLESFATAERSATETLESRLELSKDIQERLLLGEALRRVYTRTGLLEELERLGHRFAVEALSVGSTAGALALAELLGAFGHKVLEDSALTHLNRLSERQTLNVMAMWEQLVSENGALLARVSELFVAGLCEAEQHWGLLLKSPLLQHELVAESLARWCAEKTPEELRKVVLLGSNWTLTVENRPLIAAILGELEWQGSELWEQEWKRPTLSFQKLSWLAQCLERQPPRVDDAIEARLQELLSAPRRNLYFWDLLTRLVAFPDVSPLVRERVVKVARDLSRRLEAGLDEEKEAMLAAATAALVRCEEPDRVIEGWSDTLRTGTAEDLAWTFGLICAVFRTPGSPFQPERSFVSSLLQRLFQSGPDSMQQALKAALNTDDESKSCPVVLSLELQNLGFEALAAVAAHPHCPVSTKRAVERRLALFLTQWGNDLARTDDVYSFRSTPLFNLLQPLIGSEENELQALIDEVAVTFLKLQRRHPERLRLEVRQSAQSFFSRWVSHRRTLETPDVLAWERVLQDLGSLLER